MSEPQQEDDLLTHILRQVNTAAEELARATGNEYSQPDLLEQRHSPIGRQMTALTEYVRGELAIASAEIALSIAQLQRQLYTSPMGTYSLPADFHKTPLGALINEARLRSIRIGKTLNPTQAAKEVGVSRQTIYEWIRQGTVEPVWVNDRPLLTSYQLAVALKNARKAQKTEGPVDGE